MLLETGAKTDVTTTGNDTARCRATEEVNEGLSMDATRARWRAESLGRVWVLAWSWVWLEAARGEEVTETDGDWSKSSDE